MAPVSRGSAARDEAVRFGTSSKAQATAFEKPKPGLCSASSGFIAPPSAKKVVGYRVWFGAILFLEFSLLTKAETLLRAYKSQGVTQLNFLRHKWVSFGTHIIIDAAVLWFLNAFPGFPEAGLARAKGRTPGPPPPRRLRVPQHVPLLIRHALKIINRLPMLFDALRDHTALRAERLADLDAETGLSWRMYHGFTQRQVLLMVLNPTFFNVAFGGGNRAFVRAQAFVNATFVFMVARANSEAFASYPDALRHNFLDAMGHHDQFYTVVLPIVVAAPFAFAFSLRRDGAISGLEFLWRVYFGEQAELGKEAELESTPRTMVRVAGRLRRTAKRVIPLVASVFVGAAACACFTSTRFDDVFDARDAPSIALLALSVMCLAASVTVPGRLADAFSASPEGLRTFNGNVRDGAEKEAFKVAASYAATSALACALVTRGKPLDVSTRAVTTIAVHAWLPAWGIVAACACAVTPSPGVPRAARAAAAAVAVAVAGLVVIDPRANVYLAAFAREQTTMCAVALSLAYLCALHAASAWSIHARILFEDTPGVTDKEMQDMSWVEATMSGLPRARQGHWQPEDFELDPSRFEMRPRDRQLSLEDARYEFVPLSRDGRGGAGRENPFAGLCEPSASAPGVSSCRAEGCGKPVKSGDALAEGLNLCAEHMVAEKPFQCELRGGAANFCVQCRRVHSTPRCGDRVPQPLRDSIMVICARAAEGDAAAARVAPPAPRSPRDVSMRAWYKTEEGPVEATARVRAVIGDFASLQPGNARVLHAEVTARPGCTLLTVDIAALLNDDDAASGCDVGNDVVDGDVDSRRARDEEMARALADAGVRNGLDGVLDFEITGGVPSEARRRTLRRFAFDARNRASTTTELEIAPRFAHFARFRRFGLFGAESDDGATGGSAPRADDRLPVLRSDQYDVLTLPTAPEGFVYVLRCGGTYLPLLAPWDANRTATCMLHSPPSNAEGLGFIELIALQELEARDIDLAEGPADVSGRVDISPLLSAAVFITPNARLATELGDPVTGARAEHAPMLFNIGAALTGRASGAVVGASGTNGNASSSGDVDDSQRVREEAVFHAACGAASMGWSVVTTRVIANLDVQKNRPEGSEGSGNNGDDYAAWMSENPDTATDEYGYSSEYSSDGACRRVPRDAPKARRQTLGTLAGAATLMRAAFSSGDASTSRAVVAWVIRNFGAVAASDLLSAGDGGDIGSSWTPLHAVAHAVARRVQESAAAESPLARIYLFFATAATAARGAERSVSAAALAAADEAIGTLTVSGDPLCWARNAAASAPPPSAVLRGAEEVSAGSSPQSRIAAWRAGRERVALDERILRTLAEATRRAVAILRSSTSPEKPLPAHEHFTAAAAFAAVAYDGSPALTMAVALLSFASSSSWDALRARALDDARGDVSSEEAMEWLRAGAPSDGFPVPSAEEIMARDVGTGASVFCAAIDAAMMSSVILRATRSRDGYGALSPLRVGAALSQWLAPAACACARAAASPSKRLGSARRATNARVRLVGAGAQVLAARVTNRILIGSAWPALAACAFSVRCASVFVQAVAAPCGSFAKETACVALGALACAALVAEPGDFILSRVPDVSFRVALIASLIARGARWCVPRVARRRVDKLAAERMVAFEGEAKKTR